MLKLSFQMMLADLKRSFHNVILSTIAIALILWFLSFPFFAKMTQHYLTYWVIMGFGILAIREARIYHIVPLSIKQIKEMIIYRMLFVIGMLLSLAAIITVVGLLFHLEIKNDGYFNLLLYICLCMFIFPVTAENFKKERKFRLYQLYGGIVLLAAVVTAWFDSGNYFADKWQFLLLVGYLILMIPYIILSFRNMDFYDYSVPTDGSWSFYKNDKSEV